MEQISSRKNSYIRHLRQLGSDNGYRRQCGEFICDGIKTLEEAIRFGAEVTSVLWKNKAEERALHCQQYCAAEDLFDYASPLKNSPGPLFTVKIRADVSMDEVKNAVVLDGVQDPGNVGTVIRSANAFCIDTVILTGNCADLYNPKTVRATMGAIFRQRVISLNVQETAAFMKRNGMKLYGAALHRDSVDIRSLQLSGNAIAIGSEGKGLSEEVIGICDGLIIIPMNPESESLNAAVASAVLMWEMARSL